MPAKAPDWDQRARVLVRPATSWASAFFLCALSRTRVPSGMHRQPLAGYCAFAANLTLSGRQLQPRFLRVGSAPGPLSPLLSHDFLSAPAGLRSWPRGVLRAPAKAATVPVRPRGRAPRRAREAGRPPGGWGRAGRPGEEVVGRGGGGGEPRRQGGGDSAWKGGCTRICMKHRLEAGGSGSWSAAHGPGRPGERAREP